ncbi:unnamed protein product, partial [Symbiodinium sp. CCMP2456]
EDEKGTDEAKVKPSKKAKTAKPKPSSAKKDKKEDKKEGKKEDADKNQGKGTFAGRNWPNSAPASFRFSGAHEAWMEHLDQKYPRHKQRTFLAFLMEHGLADLCEEGEIYQRCHEMAVLYDMQENA